MTEGYTVFPQEITGIKLHIVGDDNVTVVTAFVPGSEEPFVGTARRAPGDPRDTSFGQYLATRRVLEQVVEAFGLGVEEYLEKQSAALNLAAARRMRKWDVAREQQAAEHYNRTHPDARERRKALARVTADAVGSTPLADWEKELLKNEDRTP